MKMEHNIPNAASSYGSQNLHPHLHHRTRARTRSSARAHTLGDDVNSCSKLKSKNSRSRSRRMMNYCCSQPPPQPQQREQQKQSPRQTSAPSSSTFTSTTFKVNMMCRTIGRFTRFKSEKSSIQKSFMWTWIYVFNGLILSSLIGPACSQGPVIEVLAVAHKKATLPCDINPPILSDSTILVLWYKDLGDMPIYSYDARSKPGSHAKNEILLGQRAYFRTVTEPASLSIDNVSENDGGAYRCRVDFLKSPTRNSKVNLTVIVPPQKPTIFDGQASALGAQAIDNGIAGPYSEGSTMTLVCVASGGKPPPKVTWWRGGELIDDSYHLLSSDGTVVQNKLDVLRLTRADLHAVFVCQASNNNISEPVTTSVQLEMFFRPLSVKLLGSNQPMSALKDIEIVCQSVGSRPPAEISWFKDGQLLKPEREEESQTGNVSTSVLRLTPRVHDHGKYLTCRTSNSRVAGFAMEDTWKMTVFFVPILNLVLGSNLDPENIREDSDVYFECKIHANPQIYKVVWLHDGAAVSHNTSAGIIMSNQSLVLQRVKRSSGGVYVCKATNMEGEGASNPFRLKIMYKPVCKIEQKLVFGVAKGEQVEIECKMDSNPKADSFKWAFNNSAESIDVPQSRFSSPHSAKSTSSSVLSYTPMTELDYGSVLCFGSNKIGIGESPCVYSIVPAGKPDPPFNCTVQNITSESLEINCVEGFDGGLPQVFHVDVIDAGSPRRLSNLTAPTPLFVVTGLRPGQAVRLFVYSSNRKGGSERVILEGQTIQEAEKRTAASTVEFELTPILGVCVGVVCGLLVVALGVVFALKFRTTPRRGPPLKVTKTEYRVEMNDAEEKNPDIIPSSKGEPDFYYKDGLFNGPNRNGNITENFRNCTYYSDKASNTHSIFGQSNTEITYAELCLDNNGGTHNSFAGHGHNSHSGLMVGSGSGGGSSGGGWTTSTIDRKRRRSPGEDSNGGIGFSGSVSNNAIIYATIDHTRRLNGDVPSHAATHHQIPPHQREIVSVRTPLLVNSQQESCV